MSWVTIIWSMTASACLTLAAVHLLVWCTKHTAWANAAFALAATVQVVLERLQFVEWPSSRFWCPTKPNHRMEGGAKP
jgi:hypothetical protein